jgi:hypothetical protein
MRDESPSFLPPPTFEVKTQICAMYTYTWVDSYPFTPVCVCVCARAHIHTHKLTHTHTYVCKYTYINKIIFVC